jgi:hypothetical protein
MFLTWLAIRADISEASRLQTDGTRSRVGHGTGARFDPVEHTICDVLPDPRTKASARQQSA